jgi:hypothetical protein
MHSTPLASNNLQKSIHGDWRSLQERAKYLKKRQNLAGISNLIDYSMFDKNIQYSTKFNTKTLRALFKITGMGDRYGFACDIQALQHIV